MCYLVQQANIENRLAHEHLPGQRQEVPRLVHMLSVSKLSALSRKKIGGSTKRQLEANFRVTLVQVRHYHQTLYGHHSTAH